MKACPFCAEQIQDAAIKCKHCGSMLTGSASASAAAAVATEAEGVGPVVPATSDAHAADGPIAAAGGPIAAAGGPIAAAGGPIAAAGDPIAAAGAAPHSPAPQQARVIYEGSPSWKAFFWQYVLAAILSLIVVGLVWLLILHLKRRSLRYKLTISTIDVESGIVSRRIETLQLWRVRDIDFHQSFWNRILGVATIHVFTKDVTDPELKILGLPGSRDIFDHLKDAIEAARQSRNLMGIVE